MATNVTTKPRIVIYGCGQYGGCMARFVVQKGGPIAAAFNRAGNKAGQDRGRVIRLDRDIGIAAEPGIVSMAQMGPLHATAVI